MIPLAEVYPVFMERYADIPEVQQGIVRIAWNYCVGAKIRKVSEPVLFENGVLQVRVPHPEWQAALDSMKSGIIVKINKYLKRPLLNDVRIELQ